MSEQIPKNTDENGRDMKGRFATGNNGKPKGATHKTTKELREFITSFLNDKSNEIPDMWDELETKDKLTLFMHLCRLVMPKTIEEESNTNNELKQPIWMIVDNSQKNGVEPITGMEITSTPPELKGLSPEQIDALIKKL
jgi:hypothetical protein